MGNQNSRPKYFTDEEWARFRRQMEYQNNLAANGHGPPAAATATPTAVATPPTAAGGAVAATPLTSAAAPSAAATDAVSESVGNTNARASRVAPDAVARPRLVLRPPGHPARRAASEPAVSVPAEAAIDIADSTLTRPIMSDETASVVVYCARIILEALSRETHAPNSTITVATPAAAAETITTDATTPETTATASATPKTKSRTRKTEANTSSATAPAAGTKRKREKSQGTLFPRPDRIKPFESPLIHHAKELKKDPYAPKGPKRSIRYTCYVKGCAHGNDFQRCDLIRHFKDGYCHPLDEWLPRLTLEIPYDRYLKDVGLKCSAAATTLEEFNQLWDELYGAGPAPAQNDAANDQDIEMAENSVDKDENDDIGDDDAGNSTNGDHQNQHWEKDNGGDEEDV
jgi:hypothetical protein